MKGALALLKFRGFAPDDSIEYSNWTFMGIRCIFTNRGVKQVKNDTPVLVCFQDPQISYLFGSLLSSRGVKAKLIHSIAQITPETRLITESSFFESFTPDMRPHCLVVGDDDTLRGIDAVALVRPLTEEKIETALSAFLNTD